MTHATPVVPASLMARLREETRPHHTAAEQHSLQRDLVSGRLPKPVYGAYLKRLHRVHEALERALQSAGRAEPRLARTATPELFQTANFEADLAFYGVHPLDTSRSGAVRSLIGAIDDAAREHPVRLLGLFYVLEGSKNGSRYIARAVRRAYALDGADGLRALDPHGEEQPALWAAFRARVDACEWSESERDEIVDAAKSMFEAIVSIANEALADTE